MVSVSIIQATLNSYLIQDCRETFQIIYIFFFSFEDDSAKLEWIFEENRILEIVLLSISLFETSLIAHTAGREVQFSIELKG